MKVNLPVNDREAPYPKGETLVSKTDLKGIVTFANHAFVNISGYSAAELLGSSHNIVRHPDMPPEAFADLWATVKAGLPWQGIVKNRCKNGDYYWVKALVVPVRENDRTVGYMSVRSEPTARERQAANDHYRAVREKRSPLKQFSLARWVFRLSFNARYFMFVAWMAFLTLAAWVAGTQGLPALTAVVLGLSVVSAVCSAWFMSVTISRPLKEAIGYFDKIAQGQLGNDIPVDRPDEVGRVLAGLAIAETHLRVMIDEIRQSTEEVERRCEQVEQQVERLSASSRDQTGRIGLVSGSMKDLSSSVIRVTQTAEISADSARTTLAVVNEGNQRMGLSIEATNQVAASVQRSSDDINRLSQSIEQIGAMTNTVKEIADQTNLLALNAAIEAARAGEQGRGFAVVADEVRKLAERTAQTTADIDAKVANIQQTTRATVAAMNLAVSQVREGRDLIEQTSENFARITGFSQDVSRSAEGIAEAARTQSSATGAVANNTEEIARLIEANSAAVAEVSDAVRVLRETSAKLNTVAAHFRD